MDRHIWHLACKHNIAAETPPPKIASEYCPACGTYSAVVGSHEFKDEELAPPKGFWKYLLQRRSKVQVKA